MATVGARPVVIDTDPGVDDALAILLALRSPELALVGGTTVCGNVPVEQATRNLYRVLQVAGSASTDTLAIGRGAAAPLSRPLETAAHVHGPDGVGELDRFVETDGRPRYPPPVVPSTHPDSLDVWAQCLRRYPHDLTLVTLGPLTNLAVALARRPYLVWGFRSIVAMAGAIAVPGNVTPAAEYNAYADPEAAAQVLEAGLPFTLVPLDVTGRVAMTRTQIARLTKGSRDPVCRFFGDATGHALDFAERVEGKAVFPFHDPLAVAVMVDPSLVRCKPLHVEVETRGRVTRGATVADRRPRAEAFRRPPNVSVTMWVDVVRSLARLKERLCPGSS